MNGKSTKILLIEDNPGDARLIGELLTEASDACFELAYVERLSQAMECLTTEEIDVILLDLSLPDSTGINTFERVQARAPEVPIIVLTVTDDAALALKTIRKGAQDYLVKGKQDYLVKGKIDSKLLVRTIRYAIERKQVEEALRESLQFSSSLLINSPHPVIVINPDTSIRYANPALERLTGFSSTRLTNRKAPYPWEPEETAQRTTQEFQEALRRRITREVTYRRRNGEPFWVEVSSTPVALDGRLNYYLVNWVDITKRKQAEQEIRRRASHLEALNAVIAAAAAATDLSGLLDIALKHTLQALDLEKGAIWRAGKSVIQDIDPQKDHLSIPEILAAGLALNQHVTVEDWKRLAADHPLAELAHYMLRFDIQASLAAPISLEEQRIGGLAVASSEPRSWTAEEIALVEAVGQQLGGAAERLRLFQAEWEQKELAEALQEAAAVVSSTLETDEVLDRILEQVERVVPGDAFNIMLLVEEEDIAQVARWRGYDQAQELSHIIERAYRISETPNLLKMVRTGDPVVVSDTLNAPDWVMLEGQEWLRSYVGAPIRIGDIAVGFLNVNGTQKNQFNPHDARRLKAFADHAATAIHNAHLYRELRNYAEHLEQRVEERTAQLQAQYARLDAILRSSSDGIIVADTSGNILQSNPVADTWLHRTLSPEDAAHLREKVRALAKRAGERPEEMLELTGLDLELSAAPIEEPGVEGTRVVIAVHDVSHLRALDRMKSRFVSNVSHELRTPITTIKLYAELMKRASPDKVDQYLNVLVQEANRQARLVEDILELSRIDTGRLDLKPRPSALNQLVEIAIGGHEMLAQEKDVRLELQLMESDSMVLVDPDQITQVLVNLMTNAIRYTFEGGRVVISTGKERGGGRTWATVTVADTGMGIPEDELPHVFERFFRGEEPRQMQIPGTGLGLAIAREIVELHGGRVTLESQVNVGTTFTLWLPLAD